MGELLRRMLEECEGRFVSGQEIGRRLGTSRAAVWKQVQALRRRGFGIEGARGAGYRLLGLPDLIEEKELFSRLSRPDFWKALVFFPVTDSTNSRAAELAGKGAAHATVVCADAQTSGRGRLGRKWESPPGVNLYLSLLLRPPLDPAKAPQLTLVAAIALAAAIEDVSGLRASLKWPNDLFLSGRKAAGILAEMAADPDCLRHVVIGVGLNVNAESSGFPAELREKATSLKISAGRPFRRVDVLARFLDSFAECYGAFMSGGFKALLPEWNRRDALLGKRVLLRHGLEEDRGRALGVDDSGRLLFRREGAHRTVKVASGEILEFER
ncbi:MAG TPA: biotin--[acetyl-CoA-carboxylase] ligase [Candidatus Deferrimicrobiaceae bacterium]|jgi:BirA family biotin operon repressor/biotin-[acetyl-CoA-carboxylase] ligase